MQQIHDGILLPVVGVFPLRTQSLRHVPVVGKRPDVDATAHASAGTKHILVAESKVQSTMATHAQPGDGSSCT